jgi:hypothetical protein
VWMERTKSEVMKDEEFGNFKHVHIHGLCQWKKEQGMKKNCIKLLGKEMEMQFGRSNNGLSSHWFYFHFLLEVMSQSITL